MEEFLSTTEKSAIINDLWEELSFGGSAALQPVIMECPEDGQSEITHFGFPRFTEDPATGERVSVIPVGLEEADIAAELFPESTGKNGDATKVKSLGTMPLPL